jgi:hypothetical protein
MKQLYDNEKYMDADDRIIFRVPLETRLMHSAESLQCRSAVCTKKQELEDNAMTYDHTSQHMMYNRHRRHTNITEHSMSPSVTNENRTQRN